MPALLRGARGSYGRRIAQALAAAGMDDVPRNGPFVLGGLARGDTPLSDIVRDLGASKQAAGQLVDTLAGRGYLERSVDAADRRRLTISLTERGVAAARIVRTTIAAVDSELAARVGHQQIVHAREALAALVEMRAEDESDR